MLFPSRIFLFLFAPLTIYGFWLIKKKRLRLLWLAVMSYIFYGYWDWRFSSLLIIVTLVNYFTSLFIYRSYSKSRRTWLILALIANLGMLGFFKYFMLLASSANSMLGLFGATPLFPNWQIVLPIGISFFTFQAMSYTIDVYRGDVKPTEDFIEFAAYIALFPQLIAGPIVRYREIREKLRNLPIRLSSENFNIGLFYFTLGLVKKMLIADRIAYFIDPMFADYGSLSSIQSWAAILGFSLQLYFDFAGYSLMAIGLGHLIGLEFPQNFNSPYKAVSISDFWRRWHMTLSRWLKDYLYIPLGGRDNRAVALAVTMLLGGLWHGAAWTFMIWGAYHAVLLELHHHMKKFNWVPRNLVWAKIGTFLVATIGWVFFRPETLDASFTILRNMFDVPGIISQFTTGTAVPFSLWFYILIAIFWAAFLPNAVELVRVKNVEPKPWWGIGLGFLAALCVLHLSESGPFLYFRF